MFEKRLHNFVGTAQRRARAAALVQWLGLLAGVLITVAAVRLITLALAGEASTLAMVETLAVCLLAAALRIASSAFAAKLASTAAGEVKKQLRLALFDTLTSLGTNYVEFATTAEITQTASEGIDQLEAYFAKYLPQCVFCVLAPLTLAAVLAPLYLPVALMLLVCAPLIPLLLFVQSKVVMRVMRGQWDAYTLLGDKFLESLQAMTTLKVYGADAAKQEEMAHESEAFRQSTMRLLRMQLGSIICMDIIAFGGAAAGVILALQAFAEGAVELSGALLIMLLSAEFFIPLRQLGSLFHVSMNGAAASRRVFALLDTPAPAQGTRVLPAGGINVEVEGLSFAYTNERATLANIALSLAPGRLVSFVGASGSGKSTMAALLTGGLTGYEGSAKLAGVELRELSRQSQWGRVVLVAHDAYLFAGTVEDNLRLAKPSASPAELQRALNTVRLSSELSLDAAVKERGGNLSGGQRQRLSIARALLANGDFYLFDEAASNIDQESEDAIMSAISELARTKTVLLISHRLANVIASDGIYLFENGRIVEQGTHEQLLAAGGSYHQLWAKQRELEILCMPQKGGETPCA